MSRLRSRFSGGGRRDIHRELWDQLARGCPSSGSAVQVPGNWLAAEGLASAAAFRGLRRPRVPHKVIEPVAADVLRRLLMVCSVRDRAIVLLMLDTGLRVSEVAAIRLGDLRPDGTLKVQGKCSKERIRAVEADHERSEDVQPLGPRRPPPPTTLSAGRATFRAQSRPASLRTTETKP
jgi:site-specific recombinase XerC